MRLLTWLWILLLLLPGLIQGQETGGEALSLQAGAWTGLILEYKQMLGDAHVHLEWLPPGAEDQGGPAHNPRVRF